MLETSQRDLIELGSQLMLPTYAPSLVLTRGLGTRVWDREGREYLDFLAGIAVTALGHCHPTYVERVSRAAQYPFANEAICT